MIHTMILTAVFWAMYFTILAVVWYIKEKLMWSPAAYGVLDFYPFICKKCLTTWTIIGAYITIGIILNNPLFAVFGTLLGIGTGIGMHETEKERMG